MDIAEKMPCSELQKIPMGKPDWMPMLEYVAGLHKKATRKKRPPFPYDWEEIGPGYCYGPAFGHWDIVHQVMDALTMDTGHGKRQLLNNLAAQQDDGLIPGSIYFRNGNVDFDTKAGHPTVWHIVVQDYVELTGDEELISVCLTPLKRLIKWYEHNRSAKDVGFYYTDILNHTWESGVDEGIRFDKTDMGPYACVDATTHVWHLYKTAAYWTELLGEKSNFYKEKAGELQAFIVGHLFNKKTGFFHDTWSVSDESPAMALEGMWPMVLGAATETQANRVINENLLNPRKFFTPHPLATVGVEDSRFELRMWRGPAWNSMTYWAARGCVLYGRVEAAKSLLERALDQSSNIFNETGTIWEFYHPFGESPLLIERKPQTPFNKPCQDYLGHNPLLAMAQLWARCEEKISSAC